MIQQIVFSSACIYIIFPRLPVFCRWRINPCFKYLFYISSIDIFSLIFSYASSLYNFFQNHSSNWQIPDYCIDSHHFKQDFGNYLLCIIFSPSSNATNMIFVLSSKRAHPDKLLGSKKSVFMRLSGSLFTTQALFSVQNTPCFSIVLLLKSVSFVTFLLSFYVVTKLVYPNCTHSISFIKIATLS